jgi:hypothetical protein
MSRPSKASRFRGRGKAHGLRLERCTDRQVTAGMARLRRIADPEQPDTFAAALEAGDPVIEELVRAVYEQRITDGRAFVAEILGDD